jgi:hypothetical protein
MMPAPALPQLHLPEGFHPTTRVWIYQSNRPFTPEEETRLHTACDVFVKNWKAHGAPLRTAYRIFFHRFICFFVDESTHGASGCSIDTSVRFILDVERQLGISLTNRLQVAYLSANGEVATAHIDKLKELAQAGTIGMETIIFNNMVANLHDVQTSWMQPLGESWYARRLGDQP